MDDARPLLSLIKTLDGAERVCVIIYDDGSEQPGLTNRLKDSLTALPGPAMLVTGSVNQGRSHARNRLLVNSRTDWLLLLDADMRPDDEAFLIRYRETIGTTADPALVAGGFSLRHVEETPATRLHAAQSSASECLSAADRSEAPGRYVFTSNILVHRQILETVRFNEGFSGWGWEDVDWGLRVAEAFPVRHIDNTATHLGLESAGALITKYAGSGANFARLANQHPDAVLSMPLYKMARRARYLPLRSFWRRITRMGASSHWLPIPLRLASLKAFRAIAYSKDLP
jgi:glycosyltransferase involved in cell wall biosynthesis